MRDHDPVLDQAIRRIAPILADALCRLLVPELDSPPVDFPAAESGHVSGCKPGEQK
jgi:hypothetical protein